MWSSCRWTPNLLTLTISTPEIVEHPVRVGRETHVQRERIQRTREIKTIRSAASLISSFKEVNKIFGAADIEFRLRHTTSDSVEAPKDPKTLTMRVSSCWPRTSQ
jgi:hypothetical protein